MRPFRSSRSGYRYAHLAREHPREMEAR